MPYRAAPEELRPRAAPRESVVSELARQFADAYAFLRELVQNALDAGASRIEVRVERDDGDEVSTSVTDDGSGMDRETLEGPLVTLFSSSKERDPGKIGKYGVGFVSVFAIEPEEVVVETWRAGEAWTMRLAPDHNYALDRAAPRDGSGTTVLLRHRMDRDAFVAHAARAQAALETWCRHVERPITLVVHDRAQGDDASRRRIDRPFAVHGSVTLVAREAEHAIAIGCVVGEQHLPWPEDEPRDVVAAFYNRGLLLHAARDPFPGLEAVRFKVDSPALAHTLSRDDVRRDETFERALDAVRALASRKLPRAIRDALAGAAATSHAGKDEAPYVAALAAAVHGAALDADAIAVPLVDAIEGRTVLSASELGRLYREGACPFAPRPDELTTALARRGLPVVRARGAALVPLLERALARPMRAAEATFTRVVELAPTELGEPDAALLGAVAEALAAAGEKVARVTLGRFDGAPGHEGAAIVPEDALEDGEVVVAARDLLRHATRWPARAVVLLDDASPMIGAARRPGRTRERAHVLARVLLLDRGGALSPRASDRLLAWALAEGP